MQLAAFNRIDAEAARAVVRPCVDIDRWVDALVDGRPYSSMEALIEAARTRALPWTVAEIDGALAHHPRIGERASGTSAEASLSRSEQAGLGVQREDTAAALAAGNRAYEEQFSRVFLIRAAGRSAEEILASLRERLTHTDEEEIPVVADQLRQIAILRLEGIFGS
ncbi:2-oxo-4-hydroxy-4-carboxy-5-ureidoimidazoline decarboxylase [Agrococcus sp. Ld7]|uniref:2-oxo-4-hydroxy-4-carboxy-5-ureidoimidazoline decarboxylase n=1 Tax=Agrococcus sp. Ld7 TaxID=649148 RepID=UPI00386FE8CF